MHLDSSWGLPVSLGLQKTPAGHPFCHRGQLPYLLQAESDMKLMLSSSED